MFCVIVFPNTNFLATEPDYYVSQLSRCHHWGELWGSADCCHKCRQNKNQQNGFSNIQKQTSSVEQSILVLYELLANNINMFLIWGSVIAPACYLHMKNHDYMNILILDK